MFPRKRLQKKEKLVHETCISWALLTTVVYTFRILENCRAFEKHWFLFNDYEHKYQAVRFLNKFLNYEIV